MGVGDLLDTTFRLFRRHFGVFFAIGVLFSVPTALLSAVVELTAPNSQLWQGVSLAISTLIGTFLYGALVRPAAEAAQGGTPSVNGVIASLRETWWPILLCSLLFLFAPTLIAGTIVGIPFAVYFWIAWSFVFQAALLEAHGGRSALSRSRQLVKGSWWRCAGISILVSLVMLAVIAVVSLPGIIVAGLEVGLDANPPPLSAGARLLTALCSVLATAIAYPLVVIAWTLLYYDLRVRKEGLDLQLRAAGLATP